MHTELRSVLRELDLLVSSGRTSEAENALSRRGKALRKVDSLGQTLLHIAVMDGSVLVTEWLSTRGSMLRVRDHEGLTPLMLACLKGFDEKTRVILGRDVTQLRDRSSDGNEFWNDWTPLMFAADGCHSNVVRLLLDQ